MQKDAFTLCLACEVVFSLCITLSVKERKLMRMMMDCIKVQLLFIALFTWSQSTSSMSSLSAIKDYFLDVFI